VIDSSAGPHSAAPATSGPIASARPRNRQRLGYKRIVQLLVYLVIVPTVLLLLVGIVLMFLGNVFNLLFGVLTVSFVLVVVTGVTLVLVFLRREANLSELQSDFVSKVSHELRTPLTSIRLFVETMERSRGDRATEDRCLEELGSQTDRLTQLIERLLDWGRMEAGRKQFDLHEQSVDAIVDRAEEAFRPVRDRHPELTFKVEVEPHLPLVHVDVEAMVDALGNLLSNALKYGGTPPTIVLRARRTHEGIALEVIDNGHGIPHREHRRIFEKFYRIDDRLARMREGSGLGLSIVKHIVRAHRGRIYLVSTPGAGSTFRIVLPTFGPRTERPAIEMTATKES
jgi:two-component system, OmpR family, phosphate regulon sensor histidine kinase PhoR